jgi:hypothetical protein
VHRQILGLPQKAQERYRETYTNRSARVAQSRARCAQAKLSLRLIQPEGRRLKNFCCEECTELEFQIARGYREGCKECEQDS